MSIRKPIVLGWNGKEHRITITMAVIDHIEDQMNLLLFVNQVSKGDVRFSKVANLFAILLNSAGVKVTQEEVYKSMFTGETNMDDVLAIIEPVINAIFPQQAEKKPNEPQGKKSSTATRGKKSTK